MKTIKTLLLVLLFTTLAKAQDVRFKAFTFTDPVATSTDGFNIGLGIEYQMSVVYFKAQTFVFPDLRGYTYTELTGVPLGFNYHDRFRNLRAFAGLKLGVILRGGAPNPTYGGETGIELYPYGESNGFSVGIMLSYDRRTDSKVHDTSIEPYFRGSGFITLGYSF